MMRIQITAAAIRGYADLTGDLAPIHLQDEAARQAGYQAPIAHGMYLMGLAQSIYLAEHRTHWIPSYSMKFHRPLVQDALACFVYEACNDSIQVTVREQEEDGDIIAKGVFIVREGVCSL
ncbi:MaoC like domain-containing protein [Paenibacillus sp. UNC496MF]|uniref:MaoC family dehydratase n=1 Tax=Paenibacillus sp. UNC496MF TaxID=1502753 RepID=UPI0008E02560|nr:MaoC family dehydratase [Paenibacillus sp. UNC496MF]SFJ17048.1 MaoC like domain-containing protein [Paenibacillus sp. UNC496MF]